LENLDLLRWRLALGVLLIAAFVGVCWLDYHAALPGVWFGLVACLLAVAAAGEMLWMLAHRDLRPLAGIVYGGNLLIVASNFVWLLWAASPDAGPLARLAWPLLATLLALIAAFAGEMRRYEAPGGVTVRLALAAFCLVYVGLLLSVLVQLRYLGGNQAGLLGLIALISVAKMGDIGAYTVGRLIGRHKMAPLLSPGKTWEGAVGGLVFAALAAWLVFESLGPRLAVGLTIPSCGWLIYGVLVGGAGMVGDLAESLLKRDLGCKDSSRWMPGFGGVLDILDSLLLAAPVGYLLWLVAVS
jgi:phosphatidate cytidylyltransferase